jgi:hypothetical protein
MVNKATEVRWAENTSCSRNEIHTQNISQKSAGKKPLRVPKYGRKDNTKKNLILFMAHSIMLQKTQTSKGFLRNGL